MDVRTVLLGAKESGNLIHLVYKDLKGKRTVRPCLVEAVGENLATLLTDGGYRSFYIKNIEAVK